MLDAGSLVVLPFPFSDLRATKRRPVLLYDRAGLRRFPSLAVIFASRTP